MSDNPYTPPGADLGREAGLGSQPGSGDFSIGQCVSDAWAHTWSNFPLWLGVGVVWALLSGLAAITVIGIFAVIPVLAWGATYFSMRMHDGGAEFGDLFAGFSRYGTALVGMLGFWLITFAIGLLAQSVQLVGEQIENGPVQAVGFLIYLGVTLVVMPRLTFGYFYIVDRDQGALEALRTAWEETDAVKWKVVGLLFVGIGVMIAGTLALVVGLIPASAMSWLMWVSAFRQLAGRAG